MTSRSGSRRDLVGETRSHHEAASLRAKPHGYSCLGKFAILRSQLACLHDQNKGGFFGGPAFIQPIRAIEKVQYSKSSDWLEKSHFWFDHVNRLNVAFINFLIGYIYFWAILLGTGFL